MSLQIGPPVRYEDAGRYICLVNNPEGHAHKEMFLEVGHHNDQLGVDEYNNKGKSKTITSIVFMNYWTISIGVFIFALSSSL